MPMREIVKVLKALADPTRLRIVLLLRRRELCVCELMAVLGMEQSRISHHMRILREAGIAEDIRDGRWIVYRMPEEARALLESLISGPLRERLESSPEVAQDVRRIGRSLRARPRVGACEVPPRSLTGRPREISPRR